MKKLAMLAVMLVTLFSASLTAFAEESPSENRNDYPTPTPEPVTQESEPAPTPAVVVELPTNVSPKTGESDAVLFYAGAAAIIFAAGAAVVRVRAKEA